MLKLGKWVEDISKETGWTEEGTVAYILTDALPVASAHTGWSKSIYHIFRMVDVTALGHATVRAWPWTLAPKASDAVRIRLLTSLREWIQDKRRSGLDVAVPILAEGDIKLLELMRREGFPPESKGRGRVVGLTAYLDGLSAAWRREYGSAVKPAGLRSR